MAKKKIKWGKKRIPSRENAAARPHWESNVSTISPTTGRYGRYCWQRYIIAEDASQMYGTTLDDAGGYSGTGLAYKIQPNAIPIGSYANLPIEISDEATNPYNGRCIVSVWYTIPVGDTSDTPIEILEN